MMPDLMGYDRAITLFSPDGRLLQVEYAKEPVLKSYPVLVLKYKNGVIAISYRSSELKKKYGEYLILDSLKKILRVDDNTIIAIAGILSDGYVLVERAISYALSYRSLYNKEIPIEYLVRKMSNYIQMVTQWGGARPFGVSIILANKNKIFMIEPSGVFFEYDAIAIGKNHNKILNELKNLNYNKEESFENVIEKAFKALTKVIKEQKEQISEEEFEVVFLDKEGIRQLPKEKIKELIQK